MESKKGKKSLLLKLFISTFYISSFTFGGGFVIVTFMKKKFVDGYGWLEEDEMMDLTAIAQSSPGAIAVNTAVLVGWKIAGFFGMIVATIGTVLPPLIIITTISFFYEAFRDNIYVSFALKGMQAAVAAIILDVVWELLEKMLEFNSRFLTGIIVLSFIATFFLNVNVIIIILATTICAVIKIQLDKRRNI